MRPETQKRYDEMLARQAELNGVHYNAGTNSLDFAVDPTVEQRLEEKIQVQSEFLQRINVIPVRDIKGQKVLLEANNTVARRTDTTTTDRPTQDPTDTGPQDYECKHTDFDTHLTYAKLDAWRKFPDFQQRWSDVVFKQIARDRLMIGWNGTSAAATSDPVTNTLLQDVNIGWLQKIRDYNGGSQHLATVTLGGVNTYQNIDALVFGMVNEMVDEVYSEDTDLVCICGRAVVADKYLGLVNTTDAATERAALSVQLATKTLGNLPTYRVPFFPADAVLVTKLSMLSIYWQEESRRREIMKNPKRSRVEDFQSVNEAYVVEDERACAFVEGITQA